MDPVTPRGFLLVTYPRTASHLLLKILALENQPSVLRCDKDGYFFMPTVGPRFKTAGKHIDEWTKKERIMIMERHQACFNSLQKHIANGEAEGKNLFVKEHVNWLIEPVSETKFVFGKESTSESPWTVQMSSNQTHSSSNETILPDEFLILWHPTFLIRHPALVFPSMYRTTIDLNSAEKAKSDPFHHTEMTMHWSRTLYDWYCQRLELIGRANPRNKTWPIILDADDIMLDQSIVIQYAERIGLNPDKLRFSWDSMANEEVEKMWKVEKRMKSTIIASSGIVEGKTAQNINIEEEAKKWKVEFGEEEGEKIERWVRAALHDYEYLKARRFRPQD
ncbi:hypothetical protein BGZ60DRAFT_398738 [Tricladium varicosporioides]|nr:hypothetical protein BGZ60DRAFT_398738 [Hymenoscyphus varicosporioides]